MSANNAVASDQFITDQIINFAERGDMLSHMIPVQLYPIMRDMYEKGEDVQAIYPMIIAMHQQLAQQTPYSTVYYPEIDDAFTKEAARHYVQP